MDVHPSNVEPQSKEEINKKFNKVKWLHFAAAVFFFIQTVCYCAVGATANVNPSIGKPNKGEECQGPICGTTQKNLSQINCIFLIPLFVALAFADHLVCYLICHFNELSARNWLFVIGSNPLRWMEYSISASVMTVAISILGGITDVHLWFLILMMTGVGMSFGAILELLPKTELEANSQFEEVKSIKFSTLRKFCFCLGSIGIFTPWLVICCYFFQAASKDMPDFVYAAFLGTLLLFITFGINSYCHNILNLYDFATAEVIYIVLSFTSKTFLAADVFGGLNASSN
jgi:hypothetical protein